MQATAIAHPNIALVKYWGKRNVELNLPAAGSISLTLGGLETETTVEFVDGLDYDTLRLDGDAVKSGSARDRVERFLDLVRERAGITMGAHVESRNNFPTAAGLASSASGFAALAKAAVVASGIEMEESELSALARRGSGSAARSMFGGFVEMMPGQKEDGTDAFARQLAKPTHWNIRCLVAETAEGEKRVGSTEGMLHTERTSPYYDSWLDQVPEDIEAGRRAIEERDFEKLGDIAVTNAMRMHASALAADPPLLYWNGTTVELIQRLLAERRSGAELFFTIDAGPHVKVFCTPDSESDVVDLLDDFDGVLDIHEAYPGGGARLVD